MQERFQDQHLQALRRVFITALTLGCGGSGGLEGPIIPIGENIGAGVCRWLRVKEANTLRSLQMAGIAAAVYFIECAICFSYFCDRSCVFGTNCLSNFFIFYFFSDRRLLIKSSLFWCNIVFFFGGSWSIYTLSEYFMVTLVAIFCVGHVALG